MGSGLDWYLGAGAGAGAGVEGSCGLATVAPALTTSNQINTHKYTYIHIYLYSNSLIYIGLLGHLGMHWPIYTIKLEKIKSMMISTREELFFLLTYKRSSLILQELFSQY